MCYNKNEAKQQIAKAENEQKWAEWGASTTNWHNDEGVTLVTAQNTNVIGLSKTRSDLLGTGIATIGKARETIEDATKAFLSAMSVNEGGRSRKFGINKYLALLQKREEVEGVLYNMLGKGMSAAQRGAITQYQLAQAQAREGLAPKPQFGLPVMMPPSNRIGGAIDITRTALSIAASVYSLGGLGATEAGPLSNLPGFLGGAKESATKSKGFLGIPWLSDRRLKENIKEVGTSPKGYKIYEFSYKGDSTRFRGAMAQDVVKKNPMAVGIQDNYLTVDYAQIDVDMEVV